MALTEEKIENWGKQGKFKNLIKALNDKNNDIRIKAVETLSNTGDKSAVDLLIKALENKNEDVCKAAAYALGKIGDASAVDPLFKLFQKAWRKIHFVRSEEMCETAAYALSDIGNKEAAVLLIKVLKYDMKEIKELVRKALAKIGKPAINLLISNLKNRDEKVRHASYKALTEIGKQAVEPLIKAMQDKSEWVRRYAADALGEIGDESAIEPLLEVLGDIGEASDALGKLGNKAVDPLIQALENGNIAAVYALGKIGDAKATEPLIRFLHRKNINYEYVVSALVELGQSAVAPLIKALEDNKEKVRESAYAALIEIGRPAVDPLIQLLDGDNQCMKYAIDALGQIGDKRAADALIKAMDNKDEDIGLAAAYALAKIGDTDLLKEIIRKRKKDKNTLILAIEAGQWNMVESYKEEAIEPLIEKLNKGNNSIVKLIESLRKVGKEKALVPLITELGRCPGYFINQDHAGYYRNVAHIIYQIIEMYKEKLSTQDLNQAASISDRTYTTYPTRNGEIYLGVGEIKQTIDYSRIRSIAKQELDNRK